MLTERKKLQVQQRLEGKELGESIGDSPRLGKGKAFSLPCMKRETRMGEVALTFKHKIGGDFPGDPVGKTPSSQCSGPGFDPWSGN